VVTGAGPAASRWRTLVAELQAEDDPPGVSLRDLADLVGRDMT
jgi:hypothetical protein